MRFASKKDLWLMLLVWLPVMFLCGISIDLIAVEKFALDKVIVGILLLPLAAGFAWMVMATDYTIRGDRLIVRAGIIRWNIEILSIASIKATRSLISGPALSLDRLEIQYRQGPLGNLILVSPQDKEAFVKQILDRNPEVKVQL